LLIRRTPSGGGNINAKLKNKVIVIVGPTASGKTNLAVKLAKRIKGEIISADSMQAYRRMAILSQKPTAKDVKTVPHHLVSFLNPEDEYSAAVFSEKAGKIIKRIIKKGKVPLVTGGSGLYIKALVDGIFPSKGKDEKRRREFRLIAEKKGAEFLHGRLKKIDRTAASRIHPNDVKRVIRALEIYEIDKKTKTKLTAKTKGIKEEYDVLVFGLTMPREKLYKKINARVDSMFRKGIVKEVKNLLGRDLSITSRYALGVKEIEGYLNNAHGLENAKDMLKRNTRRFAKRQLTWFRADEKIKWLDCARRDAEGNIRFILEAYGKGK